MTTTFSLVMFRSGTRADSPFLAVVCTDLEDEYSTSRRFAENFKGAPADFIVLVMLDSVFLSELPVCCCRPAVLPIMGMLGLLCSCILPASRKAYEDDTGIICHADGANHKNHKKRGSKNPRKMAWVRKRFSATNPRIQHHRSQLSSHQTFVLSISSTKLLPSKATLSIPSKHYTN